MRCGNPRMIDGQAMKTARTPGLRALHGNVGQGFSRMWILKFYDNKNILGRIVLALKIARRNAQFYTSRSDASWRSISRIWRSTRPVHRLAPAPRRLDFGPVNGHRGVGRIP